MLGNPVVAEISTAQDQYRTWLWLGPSDRGVELRRVRQPREVDPEEWSRAEHDPHVVERQTFSDLDEALRELAARGVDTGTFDAVWRSTNPF